MTALLLRSGLVDERGVDDPSLAEDRTHLLNVDATYTQDHCDENASPGFLVSNSDAVRSVRKLHKIAAATGTLVVPAQDLNA